MRTHETEYKRLEDAVENLKAENTELQEALDLAIEDRDYFEQELSKSENIVLTYLKDKERLDWLIDHAYIQFYKVDDGGEWDMELDASDARNHIDKEMEDAR